MAARRTEANRKAVAYPKLVDALRTLALSCGRKQIGRVEIDFADNVTHAMALLRELGEIS